MMKARKLLILAALLGMTLVSGRRVYSEQCTVGSENAVLCGAVVDTKNGMTVKGTSVINSSGQIVGGVTGALAFPATVSGTTTSGGVPYFSSTTALTSSAALAANGVVIGGGAGAAPATITAMTAGQILQGAAGAPSGTASPVLGVAGTTLGTVGLSGSGSGVVTIKPQAAAGTFNFNLPITAGTSGQVLASGGGVAAAMTWKANAGPVLTQSGALGGLASTAAATLLQACTIAPNAGHFTNLVQVTDLNGSTCTTAPTYNIRNDTGSTTGTAAAASTSAGQVTTAQTLTFAAGDLICLVRTINGGTCTTPVFTVTAQTVEP